MKLCRCQHPTRATAIPDRRLTCAGCGGQTPRSRPPTPATLKEKIDEARGFLEAVWSAYRTDHDGLWTLTRRGETAGRRPGPSDLTQATATDRDLADKRAWAGVMLDRLRRAVDDLATADAAIGQIRWVDARREPDEGRPGQWWEQGITDRTALEEIPEARMDLREAQAARLNRIARGEP